MWDDIENILTEPMMDIFRVLAEFSHISEKKYDPMRMEK
jgi:hypothetical protein